MNTTDTNIYNERATTAEAAAFRAWLRAKQETCPRAKAICNRIFKQKATDAINARNDSLARLNNFRTPVAPLS